MRGDIYQSLTVVPTEALGDVAGRLDAHEMMAVEKALADLLGLY